MAYNKPPKWLHADIDIGNEQGFLGILRVLEIESVLTGESSTINIHYRKYPDWSKENLVEMGKNKQVETLLEMDTFHNIPTKL